MSSLKGAKVAEAKQLCKKVVCPRRLHWVPRTQLTLYSYPFITLVCKWLFIMIYMSQVTPIDALVFIFIFLFALSSWHSARKRFPCHKIVFLNFHIPPRALHPPSTPLPLPPLHYFTLFSRISPTHLSLSVGHISPEEKPVLYILHLLQNT